MLVIRCLEETVYNCQIFLILIRPCAKLVNENWILIVAVKEQQSVHLCHCQLEGGWRAGPSISVSEGEVGVRGQREAYEPNAALRDNAVTQQRAMQLSDCLNCQLSSAHIPHIGEGCEQSLPINCLFKISQLLLWWMGILPAISWHASNTAVRVCVISFSIIFFLSKRFWFVSGIALNLLTLRQWLWLEKRADGALCSGMIFRKLALRFCSSVAIGSGIMREKSGEKGTKLFEKPISAIINGSIVMKWGERRRIWQGLKHRSRHRFTFVLHNCPNHYDFMSFLF